MLLYYRGYNFDSCSRDATPVGATLVTISWQSRKASRLNYRHMNMEMIQKGGFDEHEQVVDFAGGWSVWASLDNKEREVIVSAHDWKINKVQASVTVHIANKGLLVLLPSDWHDFGVSCCGADSPNHPLRFRTFRYFPRADFIRAYRIGLGVPKEHKLASIDHNPGK